MYKVFINQFSIRISQDAPGPNENTITFDQIESYGTEIMNIIQSDFILHYNPESAIEKFKTIYKHIIGAGGLVMNQNNEILFIKRLGKWDLPKGKVEKNESFRETAIREVQEECGIAKLEIIKQLPDTFHIYAHKEKVIFKQVKWFEMYTNQIKTTAQREEGIVEAKWFPLSDLSIPFANTFENIKDFLAHTVTLTSESKR
jgi:8-oxo-dGTP pyrophosphatase MutT (NUDIX family)